MCLISFDTIFLQGSTSSTSSVGSTSSNSSMEVSTRNGLNGKATPTCSSATPGTPNKHVNFGGSGASEEKKREKFLTAKYGAHQMALIRKRLRVEMWMYERLQEIYGAVCIFLLNGLKYILNTVFGLLQDDIEIDLDEVLDMDDETERRTYISVSVKFWVTFLTASIFTHFLYAFLQELLRVGCKRPLKVEHVNVSRTFLTS